MREIAGTAIEFYSCFISYSHADKEFALRLYERLYREGTISAKQYEEIRRAILK